MTKMTFEKLVKAVGDVVKSKFKVENSVFGEMAIFENLPFFENLTLYNRRCYQDFENKDEKKFEAMLTSITGVRILISSNYPQYILKRIKSIYNDQKNN
jgi:hypothetical protein